MNKALLAYLMILVGGLLAVTVYTTNQDAERRVGLIATCERVNVLRAQSNVTDIALWRVLASSYEREIALADAKGDTSIHKRAAADLKRYAGQIVVTAMTDCARAIDHPESYRPPVSGPVGNVMTGQLNTISQATEGASRRRLNE